MADVLHEIILDDGTTRRLGNIIPPEDRKIKFSHKLYGDDPSVPMVARSKWPDIITNIEQGEPGFDHAHLPYVHDQDGVGQCNCDATCAVLECMMLRQGLSPEKLVPLSAGDLYDRINGGSDNGSSLEDGIVEAKKGVASVQSCGTNIWHRGWRSPSAGTERPMYRLDEAFLCPTFDHCMSAVIMGFPLVSGIMWYDMYKPDGDGWLPRNGRGPGGGHAVFGYKPAMLAKGGSPEFGIRHQNSWGEGWGVHGRCVFPEVMYKGRDIGGWWAVRSVIVFENQLTPTPSFN